MALAFPAGSPIRAAFQKSPLKLCLCVDRRMVCGSSGADQRCAVLAARSTNSDAAKAARACQLPAPPLPLALPCPAVAGQLHT
jgi:hypothetical protein